MIETLTTQSFDEVGTEYGLVAESIYHPEDFSSVSFRLRKEARWHDGKPITAEDVIYGFNFLKENNPQYQFYYRNVEKVEQTGDSEVTFFFDSKGNRELPGIMGQVAGGARSTIGKAPMLPARSATSPKRRSSRRSVLDRTASRASRPASRSPSSGSRIIGARSCRSISASNNFDEIEIIYFRDRNIIFEAFKADQIDVRLGPGTKEWETQYDFPAVKKGNVIKATFTTKNAEQMQGFVFNTRRAKFADPRVRHAFNLAYDFEGRMRVLSFGDYNKRTQSYFQNSELAATGLAAGPRARDSEPVQGPDSGGSVHHRIQESGQRHAAEHPREPAQGGGRCSRKRDGRSRAAYSPMTRPASR